MLMNFSSSTIEWHRSQSFFVVQLKLKLVFRFIIHQSIIAVSIPLLSNYKPGILLMS